MSRRINNLKAAFQSKDAAKGFLRAKGSGTYGESRYNRDLLPTPIEDRRWKWPHYFSFYLTASLGASSYNLGASFVATGLLWWHGLVAAAIGGCILTGLVVLHSRGATQYFVGFPVFARAVGGVRGASLYIVCRCVVAIVYYSTQTYYGGQITSVLLRAIFGNSYYNLPNHLPASAGITSRDLLSFFIFWLVQCPLMFVHPKILRHFFVAKATFSSAALFGVLGWAVHANGGSLGDFKYTDNQKSLSGAALAWPMLGAINSVMGALCAILMNQPDVARYARSYKDVTWSQAAGIMTSKIIVIFIGACTTSASKNVLGKAYWNIWDLYHEILTQYWSSGARAGIAFASIGVMLAILVTNAGSNSLPVGADLTGIWPKWMTIIRGQILCAFLAPLLVPWKMISSANAFLTFLGSYPIFLVPVVASMIIDYWYIRRGNLHIPSLYVTTEGAPYTYYRGWNLRMLAAWICSVGATVHGLAGAFDSSSVSDGSLKMYKLSFLVSGAIGALVYTATCLIWPPAILPKGVDRRQKLGFEELARTEGFLDGESLATINGIGFLDGVPAAVDVESQGSATPKKAGSHHVQKD